MTDFPVHAPIQHCKPFPYGKGMTSSAPGPVGAQWEREGWLHLQPLADAECLAERHFCARHARIPGVKSPDLEVFPEMNDIMILNIIVELSLLQRTSTQNQGEECKWFVSKILLRWTDDKDGQSAGVAHIPKIIPMFAVQRCAKCHSTSAPHITAGSGYPVVSWILCSISCGTLKLPTSSQERAQRTFASCWCVRATATLWSFGLQAPCFNWDWANRHEQWAMSCEKKVQLWVGQQVWKGIAPGAEQAWESTASKHPPRYLIDSSRNPKSINSQTPRLRIIAVQHSKTQPEWKRWNAWA